MFTYHVKMINWQYAYLITENLLIGDTSRIFEEHYTFGENRGNGQGM